MREAKVQSKVISDCSTMSSTTAVAAALTVPILPHTSPAAEKPAGLQLDLYPHQLRALHRCRLIEQDGTLGSDFGDGYNYTSRGGCLADAVGTGKTATIIALVLASAAAAGGPSKEGDTLVVAPAHLIPQWKQEIEKFGAPGIIQVVVGKQEYEQVCSTTPPAAAVARIVLVDIDTIRNETKLWYDWRRVYRQKNGIKVRATPERQQLFRQAALFCVKSPKGPCSYDGWIYTGQLHLPPRPWRRVILDEIQDLVLAGTDDQKNLLQLTRTAQHVWLLTATPFPHGRQSIYANHELLGFCRLHLHIADTALPLPEHHTFERIKRKIYIRSPRHVADQAVTVPVTRNTITVTQLELEKRFYELEYQQLILGSQDDSSSSSRHLFSAVYDPLREMTVHPEASQKLRTLMSSHRVRPVSTSMNGAARNDIADCKRHLAELASSQQVHQAWRDTQKSLDLAVKVQQHRTSCRRAANPFGMASTRPEAAVLPDESKLIHDHYCGCSAPGSGGCYASRHVSFRVIREQNSLAPEFMRGSLERVIRYFSHDLGTEQHVQVGQGSAPALQHYITVTQRTAQLRAQAFQELEQTKHRLTERIAILSQVKNEGGDDPLATQYGSKPAALVRFLQSVGGEKVIVFSYWHDTLKLIGKTLEQCGLHSVFCGGTGAEMAKALQAFTTGFGTNILLLSAKSKASGANLQCATRVVLLDPAGSSAEHGSTLEEQSIGRAVRMGQKRPVTVTRFCVRGTIEEQLFQEIDLAATKAKARASDSTYVIHDAHKTLPIIEKAVAVVNDDGKSSDGDVVADDDIQVTVAITGEERIRRKFKNAEEKGYIIVVDSEEKTENDALGETSLPFVATPSSGTDGVVMKEEPGIGRRSEDSAFSPEPKRIRTDEHTPPPSAISTTTQETDDASRNATVTPHEAVENRMKKLGDLLCRLDLTEYESKFSLSGYDSLDFLCQFSDHAEVMERVSTAVGFKPGHAVRFQIGLAEAAKKSTATVAVYTARV